MAQLRMITRAVVTSAIIICSLTAVPLFNAPSLLAQQVERSGLKKWEYCAIVWTGSAKKDSFSAITYEAMIRYFPNRYESVAGQDEDDAVANAITKLGEEGWEMVSVNERIRMSEGSGESSRRYYFKRPK